MSSAPVEVYTVDEVARAVGVPATTVRQLSAGGALPALADGAFFAEADVLRLAPLLRTLSASMATSRSAELFSTPAAHERFRPLPLVASVGAHGVLLALAVWLTPGPAQIRPLSAAEAPRLIFLSLPGPGGGGGGSGAHQPRPSATLQRMAGARSTLATPPTALTRVTNMSRDAVPPKTAVASPVPDVTPNPPEPLPSRSVVAPVVMTASQRRHRDGVVEHAAVGATDSLAIGTGGRAGAGQGEGNGDGLGSGIGRGGGGGAGGGPYRPGTGIEPPRLLREVKADYTESARRRQIAGEVLLEIVVNRDGSVGEITVTKGLGEGLDQKAVAAVRQWQFAPARRLGQAVDVIVDVSVEFKLR